MGQLQALGEGDFGAQAYDASLAPSYLARITGLCSDCVSSPL